ncbi:MAG: ComEC/Rec2 family competence protein [Eubacteriales bacterium]|nr:ComEC/Rec2 family competence protein [Eubacteriales bacterium]
METTPQGKRAPYFQFRALCVIALGLSCGVFFGSALERAWLFAAVCLLLLPALLLSFWGRPGGFLFFAALAAGLLRMGAHRFLHLELADAPFFAAAESLLNGIRDALYGASDALFPKNAGLMKGMLFGYRTELNPSTLYAFQSTGLSHILALSGMNISLYAFLILKLIPKKYRLTRFFAVGLFSLLYCAVTAFPASLARAAVMTQCVLLSGVFKRRSDLSSSLSLAAIILLLIAPMQLFDIGYELSFAAVYAIALFYEPFKDKLSFLSEGVAADISLTACGTLGTFPISAHYFGSVAWLTLFSNILILPVASLGLIVGLVAVLLFFLSPSLASAPAFLGDFCASVTVRAAELIAKLPFAVTKFEKLPMPAALLLYSAMALLSRYNLKRPAVKYLSGGAAFLLAAAAMLVF